MGDLHRLDALLGAGDQQPGRGQLADEGRASSPRVVIGARRRVSSDSSPTLTSWMKSLGRRSWSRSGSSLKTSSATVAMAPSTPPIASYASLVRTAPRRCFHNCSSKKESSGNRPGSWPMSPRIRFEQARLELQPHLGRGGLDDLPEFPLVHGAQGDLGILPDAVDQGAIVEDAAVEIRPACEDDRQRGGLRGVQQLVDEGADDLVIPAERVELLPLVDDQQQPLRPRLLAQGDFGEVAEGQRPLLEAARPSRWPSPGGRPRPRGRATAGARRRSPGCSGAGPSAPW